MSDDDKVGDVGKVGDVLMLVPGGYPVTIDVAQATIGGAGTAMHFVLPKNGHNLPLMHRHETKLLAALEGQVEIRSGGRPIALLREGEAVLLRPGVAHRVHQRGDRSSTVGVALWPGAVEGAFRQLAASAVHGNVSRADMTALFAGYGVEWNAPSSGEGIDARVRPLTAWLGELPPDLARGLERRWHENTNGRVESV